MSHASGEIWSTDGALCGFFEYDGTADVVCARVHLTAEEMRASWRGDNRRDCACGSVGQPVILYTSYDGGFYWLGRVCWICMAVTDGLLPFGGTITDGRPFATCATPHTLV